MFGRPCKVCQEKNSRIEDLKSEITQLRKLVYPAQNPNILPMVNLEANKILNVDTEITTLDEDELSDHDKVSIEADRIFNGDF